MTKLDLIIFSLQTFIIQQKLGYYASENCLDIDLKEKV